MYIICVCMLSLLPLRINILYFIATTEISRTKRAHSPTIKCSSSINKLIFIRIRIRIYLLARRNLLWDILRLLSSRRAALGLYVILTLCRARGANQPPYALLHIGARHTTHCATGDECYYLDSSDVLKATECKVNLILDTLCTTSCRKDTCRLRMEWTDASASSGGLETTILPSEVTSPDKATALVHMTVV